MQNFLCESTQTSEIKTSAFKIILNYMKNDFISLESLFLYLANLCTSLSEVFLLSQTCNYDPSPTDKKKF